MTEEQAESLTASLMWSIQSMIENSVRRQLTNSDWYEIQQEEFAAVQNIRAVLIETFKNLEVRHD